MGEFIIKKSKKSNIYKSIRFPVEINDQIYEIINNLNEGLEKKMYSFNGFVISACEFALENIKEEKEK